MQTPLMAKKKQQLNKKRGARQRPASRPSAIYLHSWEIYYGATDEEMYQHEPDVAAWSEEAVHCLLRGEFARARALLEAALAREPEAVDLMNNFAAALEGEGQTARAYQILKRVHELRPDYFFGLVALARLCARRGSFKEAAALLAPARATSRLHISEFVALCSAEIHIACLQGQPDVARCWLKFWEDADPRHPNLQHYRRLLETARPPSRTAP